MHSHNWTNARPCRWTHMKQPFCACFLLLTTGGDAVSIVAAQLVGGRVGCGFRTAASRLVVVVVVVVVVAVAVALGSLIKRLCCGGKWNYCCKERAALSASRNNAVRGAQTLKSNLNPRALEQTDSGETSGHTRSLIRSWPPGWMTGRV